MGSGADNPFQPDFGAAPPLLAGREGILSKLDARLDRILQKKNGGCLALYGPRGNGKTVLIDELGARAIAKGATVRELDSESFKGGERTVVADLMEERETPEKYVERLEIGPRMFKGGADVTALAHHWIRAALFDLADKSPAVLLIDEAHTIPPEIGGHLLTAIQRCIRGKLPLLALMAGTPELPDRLRQLSSTFWERAARLPVGRLESDEAARAALSVPASQSGLPFDEDALELLVKDSQRYPFFVQLVGSASWGIADARTDGPRRITLADAQAGVREADFQRALFYGSRREEIVSQKVLYAAEQVSKAIAEQEDGVLPWQMLEEVLVAARTHCVHPPEETLDRLRALGLIWETEDGKWEPGIPSLCSYLIDNIGKSAFGRDRY